jgi:ankyrin repeat protein
MDIHEAAFVGNLNRVRALLNQGVPVNARNDGGWTTLHTAAFTGHLNIVQELLRRGARVNPRTNYYSTPLHYAALRGHSRVVHELLKAGANPKYRNRHGNTPYNRTRSTSTRHALKTSRAASKWLETTRKRKLDRQKVASLTALRPLPLNIKRRILSNAGLKKKSP